MQDTPNLALNHIKGVGMYFWPLCYGNALNCHFVYLAIPGTPPLLIRKQKCLIYLYATAKSEIHICSNKHETGLVFLIRTGNNVIFHGWHFKIYNICCQSVILRIKIPFMLLITQLDQQQTLKTNSCCNMHT